MTNRFVSSVWGCVVVIALGFIAGRVSKGVVLDTSLLSLLPASESDPLLREAQGVLSQRASRMMGFVVGHAQAATAIELNQQLKTQLTESSFVQSALTDLSAEQQKAFYDFYFPLRYQVLSPEDRLRLQGKNPLNAFIARLTGGLLSPASSFLKDLIPNDPFLFFPELIRSWAATAVPRPAARAEEGISFVDTDGTSYAFTAVDLALDPFDPKNQDRMLRWLGDLRKDVLARWPGARLYMSGVLPFASAERLRTEREMAFVSAGAFVGVLLLTLWVFASVRALVLSALPITVGFVVATAGTLLYFGKIHILTFAFGSSLIGVATDYPLLYLATHRTAGPDWDPRRALREITPDLLLGAATTLIGYMALSLAPFPGLRQMAFFSCVGLGAALITVIVWLPPMLKKGPARSQEPRILTASKTILSALHRRWKTRTRSQVTVAGAALALFTVGGLVQVRFNDDVGRLQNPPPSVSQEDAFVRKAMNGFGGGRFLLVRGGTLEELLERQERLQESLHPLLASGALSSVQSLAPFLPSRQRQQEDRRLLQAAFAEDAGQVRGGLRAIGLASGVAARFLQDLHRPLEPFSIDAWQASPASSLLRPLWIGPTAHGFASAVLVGGLSETGVLKEATKAIAGVRFFDPTEEYTELFRRYRHLSMGLIFAAYIAVWGILMFRYGLRRGTWATTPAVGGVLLTFAIFGWCGLPLQLIHCLSALLVLSMGVDCSIYYAECARERRPVGPTLLAVVLCAGSTLLSFGLLAFCRTPVLSAVGLTVFSGMAIAFVLSPLPYLESDL